MRDQPEICVVAVPGGGEGGAFELVLGSLFHVDVAPTPGTYRPCSISCWFQQVIPRQSSDQCITHSPRSRPEFDELHR